jgi:two-component system sensor histidine kinase EvgS
MTLRVLIVEDQPIDAELMVRELRRAGHEPAWQRVETEPDYLRELNAEPDVILADYKLPQFSAPRALELLRASGLSIPLIVVTGAVGEDAVVQCMRQGAADYLLKDRLARLGPAVAHSLEQHELQRQAESDRESRRRLDAENRELHRVNMAHKQFVSVVSHELKTPLTAITAFADILAHAASGNLTERQVQQIGVIQRNSRRMADLVEDLLDTSRVQAGTIQLEPTRFDASLLFAELVENLGPTIAGKRQTLQAELPPGDVKVLADRRRLGQAISNLLSNASKYSEPETSISFRVSVRGRVLYIAIADQGIGISPEDQSRLFTPFFRTDNPAALSVPGTGLGLFLVKSLVELHEGEICVESEPGAGTTVRMEIPCVLEQQRTGWAA